jgi:hypothetical protein
VAQLYPQAPGTHFSRLLRHAWFTVGLFLFPGHHAGKCGSLAARIRVYATQVSCPLKIYLCCNFDIHAPIHANLSPKIYTTESDHVEARYTSGIWELSHAK